jgi:hypothetical protein
VKARGRLCQRRPTRVLDHSAAIAGLCGRAPAEASMDNMNQMALGDVILVIFGALIVLAVVALF